MPAGGDRRGMQLNVEKLRAVLDEKRMSQTDLARASAVSRATIARLLAHRSRAYARGTTQRRLSKALALGPGALDADAAATAYLDAVAARHEYLDFAGLGVPRLVRRLPMDGGYVPVPVRPSRVSRAHDASCIEARQRDPSVSQRPREYPLPTALARRGRLFLLGDPGSGKTTILRNLARNCAVGRGLDEGLASPSPVPVFLRLADWADLLQGDSGTGLLAATLAPLGMAQPEEVLAWLQGQAKQGNLLLLLDGLDEVPDADAQALLLERTGEFLREHRGVSVVISSRVVGFDCPDLRVRFDVVTAQPLGLHAMRTFAAQWCAFRHGHEPQKRCDQCEQKLEELRHAILDHPRIGDLARNPMMLTILALLHEAGAALPQRRWDLYQKITEAFLFSWEERKRTLPLAADRRLRLDDRETLWILESVALEMQRRDWTLAARWWLLEHISGFLRDELDFEPDDSRAAADTLLGSLQRRSGVMVERGPERFGFSHLAFQEYFAARALLATDDPLEAIRPALYHPRWVEVVRLLAAQLDRGRAPKLLRMLLDDPDPTGRFLRRGLLTALACLADGAPVHDRQLIAELRSRVADLGRSKWLGIALDAVRRLSELRGTRLEDFARSTVEALLAEARESLEPQEAFDLAAGAALSGLLARPTEDDADLGRGDPDEPTPEAPIFSEQVRVGDKQFERFFAVVPDRYDRRWVSKVLAQLRAEPSPGMRGVCAEHLAAFADRGQVRQGLLAAFGDEPDDGARAAIARALGRAAKRTDAASALMGALARDDSPEVRGACADALRSAAPANGEVRRTLVSLLESREEPAIVRAGAAGGLSRSAARPEVRRLLFRTLKDAASPDETRASCVHALRAQLPRMPDEAGLLPGLLDGPESVLSRAATLILADLAATGKVPWDTLPVAKIEEKLRSLQQPCPHVLGALRALMNARERRRLGIPREARIRQALAGFEDRLRAVFVFGSAARGEQRADSDIDLMVIGDVSLRQLAPVLTRVERELGRQVNALIYSEQEWRSRCLDRDAFTRNVLAREKRFVIGDAHELAAMAGQLLDQAH